jgi:hypothetical protein
LRAVASGCVGYSGLIYAAIVAAWAAVLVPRWVRRNEEVDQVRELDAVRGVRVLARSADASRPGHGKHGVAAGMATFHDGRLTGASALESRAEQHVPAAPAADWEEVSDVDEAADHRMEFGDAARRRRRVLLTLALLLAVAAAAVTMDRLPQWSLVGPLVLLVGFLVLARRAAVAEARRRRRATRARPARQPATVEQPSVPKRIAVLEEPEPVAEADPDAWKPVPVPLPTYVTKAVAPQQAARRIDLSLPGAWTSGRLDPAASVALPPARTAAEQVADKPADLPEHRRAVGD